MKTLDEVIEAMEACLNDSCRTPSVCETCSYTDPDSCCGLDEMNRDALHYLKEYHEYLKWQAHEKHCLAEEKKKIKQAYEQGYAQAKHDDEVNRRWEESYRQSQMPWNKGYCEMGG